MGEVVPQELPQRQREHWENQLVIAERAVEYALRMLGRTATTEVKVE